MKHLAKNGWFGKNKADCFACFVRVKVSVSTLLKFDVNALEF